MHNHHVVASCLLVLPALWGVPATAATATVVFESGAIPFGSAPSDFRASQFIADDFRLPAGGTVIGGIQWKGQYGTVDGSPVPDDFFYFVYADENGLPDGAMVLASGRIGAADSRMDTGIRLSNTASNIVFEYAAQIEPIALEADRTYWLSLANDTTGQAATWSWVSGISGSTNGVTFSFNRSSWATSTGLSNRVQDFVLVAPVPVPAALPMFGAGVLGIFALLNRRRA